MNIKILEEELALALQSGATKSGYNFEKANHFLQECGLDKRYKMFALSGTCSWAYNEHGYVQYRGMAFSYQQSETGYEVKHDPTYRSDLLLKTKKARR